MSLSFMHPWALLLLFLLPCFVWCKLKIHILYFSKPEWLPKQAWAWDNLTFWLMLISALLVFALAHPFYYESEAVSHKKGRDLVLVMDTSGSMAERGFAPENRSASRYEVSTALAKAFIRKRYDDNIGLVVFGTYAYTASPLTYDRKALSEMFDLMSDVGIAGESTAIGDALMQGVRTLQAGEAESKVLILLTDGKHNAGKNSPRHAVDLAKELGIQIYTMGIGKKGAFDQGLLETIANESGGKSFAALNASALEEVYEEINRLEPSPLRSEQYLDQRSLFMFPLLLALLGLFAMLWRYEERA